MKNDKVIKKMIFGWPERSTYHTTMVNRVNAHLRRICTAAEKEMGLVYGRITDAWGYDGKTRTYYVCEIKVNFKDLQKAIYQIHDTAFRYKPRYDKDANIIPVIAFPKGLYKELVDYENWGSLSDACNKLGVAIWVIEQSAVRQVQGPKPTRKPKTVTKPKPATRAKTKTKSTIKPKSALKVKTTTKPKITHKPKTTTKTKSTIRPKSVTKAKAITKIKATHTSRTATKSKPAPKARTVTKRKKVK